MNNLTVAAIAISIAVAPMLALMVSLIASGCEDRRLLAVWATALGAELVLLWWVALK